MAVKVTGCPTTEGLAEQDRPYVVSSTTPTETNRFDIESRFPLLNEESSGHNTGVQFTSRGGAALSHRSLSNIWRRGFAVASACLLSSLGVFALAAAPARANTAGPLVPSNPHELLPLHGGTVDSLNWAGYAVTPGSGVTAVNSTFTVPSAGSVPPGFSATWAGIGGYNTTDLIQAGVSEQSVPSDPVFGTQYSAWYEILPAAETPISGCSGDPNCTVTPGESISVDIHNVSGNTWAIDMSDAGHWTYSNTLTYASSESSAEWIQEAPTLVAAQTIPAPVGTVQFGPTSTDTASGTTSTIAAGNPTLINESPGGAVNEATTSPLAADGQSFNVCVYAQTCAAP